MSRRIFWFCTPASVTVVNANLSLIEQCLSWGFWAYKTKNFVLDLGKFKIGPMRALKMLPVFLKSLWRICHVYSDYPKTMSVMSGLGKKIHAQREAGIERDRWERRRERETENSQNKEKRSGGTQQKACDRFLHKTHSHHWACPNAVSSPPRHYSSKAGWSRGSDATSFLWDVFVSFFLRLIWKQCTYILLHNDYHVSSH